MPRTSQFAKHFLDFARQISIEKDRNVKANENSLIKIITQKCKEENTRHTKLKRANLIVHILNGLT